MMNEEQRTEWLLELQDHPEQLTEKQLQQIFSDYEMLQLVQQLGFAKRAFKHDSLKNDTPDVDAEWEKFAANHANELTNAARAEGKLACTMPCKEEEDDSQLDALSEGERKPRFRAYLAIHKIAASFIGVLLASGIAFAAIQVVRNINTSKPQLPITEQAANMKPVTSLPADTVKTDTVTTLQPVVFDNVALGEMLPLIAAYYHKEVEFLNADARQLRFYFVWKRDEPLDAVLHRLNLFESINVELKSEKIIVE